MPLNLSARWTASSSMMCSPTSSEQLNLQRNSEHPRRLHFPNFRNWKKLNQKKPSYLRMASLLIILCAFFLCLPVSISAAAASVEEISLPGESDILLLHSDSVTDEQLNSLRILADSATALSMSMELGTPAQADGLYEHYKLILCYDLDSDPALAKELAASGARLMILGGSILPDCVEAAGGSAALLQEQRPSTSAVLSYTFSAQQSYQTITSIPDLFYVTNTVSHTAMNSAASDESVNSTDSAIAYVSDPDKSNVYAGSEDADGAYENGTLEVNGQTFPLCSELSGIRYIPLTDYTQDLSRAAITREISAYMWDYSGLPPQKGQYIVLDNVYAYMPAQELLDRVDVIVEAGLPFVISVMPVYLNTDYPAMQQFCEVLRYAQANGGAVILRAPQSRTSVTDWDAYNVTITEVLTSYTSQGVYPLGFDVPYSWTWNEDALTWMQRSRTIFVYSDSAETDFTLNTQQNLLFYNYNALVLPALSLDDGGENCVLQFSASRRISASVSMEDLQDLVSDMQNNASAYYSLWDNTQSVWANSFHLNWDGEALTLNDAVCSLTYTPQAAEEDYEYNRNTLKRFTVSIQNESHFLIVLVSVVTVLFLLMILYARHMQRKRFLPRMSAASEDTTQAAAVSAGRTPNAHTDAGNSDTGRPSADGDPESSISGQSMTQMRNGGDTDVLH